MKLANKRVTMVPSLWSLAAPLIACFVLSGVIAGQDLRPDAPTPAPQQPVAVGVQLKTQFRLAYDGNVGNPPKAGASATVIPGSAHSEATITLARPRLITLQEAQQKAAPAGNNPMVCLGQLQVEVARQTRLGTMSTFFPQIGSTFYNMHFNKFMGKLLEVTGPRGNTFSGEAPLIGQNETFVAVTATQPPLFQLRELYKINLADERIARAKAGMPVSETASKVEKAYYDLLVAQRQLAFSKAKAMETENKWLVASSATPVVSDSHDEELIETSNTLAIATTKVKRIDGRTQ